MNVASVLDGTARDVIALVHHADRITYGDVADRVESVAAQLTDAGVEKGDRIALICANTPTFVVAFLGVAQVGAVAVPLNPSSPAAEIARQLETVAAVGIVVGPVGATRVRELDISHFKVVLAKDGVVLEGADSLAVGGSRADSIGRMECDGDDPVVLMFTSGTAGEPQAACLTHANILANIDQMGRHPGGLGDVPPVVLGVLPFSHIYGLTMVLAFTLSASGAIVLMERFDASAALAAIESEAVTVVAGAPAMWNAFASLSEVDSAVMSTVQFGVSGAAPLAVETHQAVLERFGIDIREGYGLTEASPAVTSAVGTTAPPGSVGRPLPGVEVRLVEPSGSDALIGDEGELWVRGPNVFSGYVGPDGSSNEALDSEGWLHTGDIALVDDDGNLYLVDRAKDLIIVSGFNVHPAEVENALRTHPVIADAGAVGAPDPVTGETVHAAVVVEAGASIEVDQIIDHCAAHLARYKCPTAIDFVDVIPRSDSGKVLRRALRRS